MVVDGHAPPADLAPLVGRFLVLRSPETTVNTLLPTSGITLVFRVRGAISDGHAPSRALPSPLVTGPRERPRSVVYAAGTLAYLVELVPGAGSALVPGDLEALRGRSLPADTVLEPPLDVEGALREASSDAEGVAILVDFLRRRRRDHRPHRLVEDARALVAPYPPGLTVGHLVDRLGTNKDSLEKQFRREWGVPPKVVLRIERLRALIASLDAAPGATWAHRAAEWGYADQSHLNHEFRALVGRAPQAFLQGRRW